MVHAAPSLKVAYMIPIHLESTYFLDLLQTKVDTTIFANTFRKKEGLRGPCCLALIVDQVQYMLRILLVLYVFLPVFGNTWTNDWLLVA